MKKLMRISFRSLAFLCLLIVCVILMNSALDIYNNFAYDKAILKDSPHGWTPLLSNPQDYSSGNGMILSGEFVYVEDWLSAYNNSKRIAFAKVKSKLKEGYINKELLVEANLNVKPIISVLLLMFVFAYSVRKLYLKFTY